MEKKLARINIREFFDIKVKEDFSEEFRLHNLKENLNRGKIIAAATLVVELFVIVISLVFKKNITSGKDAYYYFMYLIFVVVVSFFLIILIKMEAKPRLGLKARLITYGFLFFMLSWNMGISVLDGQITSYIIALLAISIVAIIRPAPMLILYSSVHMIYLVLLLIFGETRNIIFASFINSTIAAVISWTASYILYKNRTKSFINEKEVEDKRAQLESLNLELNRANKKLEYLSQTDGLTGIYNRRMFDRISNDYWKECFEAGDYLTVIMIDIDHFKIFNDTYGHQKGDDCLKDIVSAIKSLIPEDSMLARYGGEEFAILVKNSTKGKSFYLAEQIRSKIADMNIEHKNSPVKSYVTLSLGVFCGHPKQSRTILEFISRADRALYEAKNGGRDMTIRAEWKRMPEGELASEGSIAT